MSPVPPADAVRPLCWDARTMDQRGAWRWVAGADVRRDAERLRGWARTTGEPVSALRPESVPTPALAALAASVRRELDEGSGVAWIQGLGELSELSLRLAYLKLGLELGASVDTYGRLYEVKDSGASYRTGAIPVSQTRESTGMHTDSSGREVWPRLVGLACVRQARTGGGSRLVSAAQAHERLRASHPRLLARLYETFIRDIVTPGSARDPAEVAANRFPVFSFGRRLALRYMRYWIERGHERAGERLDEEATRAFDALDAALSDPAHVVSFRMAPGDLLFIDNTTVAHDRDAYEEDPDQPRLMLRLWLAPAG
jgi:alpha-ketoglutarate-dependent taurine dioxygenase